MDASSRRDRSYQIGLVLVILGGLALLSNVGLFAGLHHLVGALLFGVLGGLALRHYMNHHRIGALIGAFALFGLAAATVAGALSGFFFLGLIGLGFAAVYWNDRERWWAIIPAGTLLSLAVVAGLDHVAPRYESGSVLFIGLAATFVVLYRLPGDPKRWAIYPAVAMLALAVLGLSIGGSWVLPLALVGVGVYLLYRRGEQSRVAVAPASGEGELPAEDTGAASAAEGTEECAAGGTGGSAAEASTDATRQAHAADPKASAGGPEGTTSTSPTGAAPPEEPDAARED